MMHASDSQRARARGATATPRQRSAAAVTSAIAIAMLAMGCGPSDSSDACAGKTGTAGTRVLTVESGGALRTVQVTAPESALQGAPVPLVLVYHGVFSEGDAIQTVTGMREKAAAEGFITAAGDGIGRSWNAGLCCDPAAADDVDDVGFTRDMVAAIEAEYCIDESRIYATGFSNGAAMVFRLACEASDLFASFVPVAGSLALFPCEPEFPRAIDIINNVDDPVVPFDLGEFSVLEFYKHDSCSALRETTEPAANTTCEVAPDCAEDTAVLLCGVEGLSHEWPGGVTNPEGPFYATDVAWEFFTEHPL
jgi:polyhydroxybutyrate depolymerase